MNQRRFRADDPERKTWQDPEKIFSAIGLSAGMIFVDIGCGEGYFALPAARRVGPCGKVWTADINSDAVAALWEQVSHGRGPE
jgi:ubiquinone/menaquinone biosynthesis C-methylase UbiE